MTLLLGKRRFYEFTTCRVKYLVMVFAQKDLVFQALSIGSLSFTFTRPGSD